MGILSGSDLERIKDESLDTLTAGMNSVRDLALGNNSILYGRISTKLNTITSVLNSISSHTTDTYLKVRNGVSVIKSVQRGVVDTEDTVKIPLSTVNPLKCHVTLHNRIVGVSADDSLEVAHGATVVSLTSTTLEITRNYADRGTRYTSYGDVSWEVIEFY